MTDPAITIDNAVANTLAVDAIADPAAAADPMRFATAIQNMGNAIARQCQRTGKVDIISALISVNIQAVQLQALLTLLDKEGKLDKAVFSQMVAEVAEQVTAKIEASTPLIATP